MQITIPLPIPVPTIEVTGDEIKIDRSATELAKQQRKLGAMLSIDNENTLPICCACKAPKANQAFHEAPEGFRWGGWFCPYCLSQGKLAYKNKLVIDQALCTIELVVVFDKLGIGRNDLIRNMLTKTC